MLRALALIVAILSISGAARAAKVVLLAPPDPHGDMREAVTRTRAELSAEGFEVELRELDPRPDLRAALELAASEAAADAAIAVFFTSDGAAADLWVTDRITGKTSVRQVRVDGIPLSERPRVLSIRAVELLRASLVEAVAPETRDHPLPHLPRDIDTWLSPAGPPLDGFSAELSVAMLASFDGVSPAGAPSLSLGYGGDHGIAGRIAWLGPAFGARADGPRGGASIRQELLLLELVYAPEVAWGGLTPLVSLGAGGYHLDAFGDVSPPLVGRRAEIWAGALSAGVGLGYRLTPQIFALAQAKGLITLPQAVVTVDHEPIGSAGLPSLVGSIGVAVRFE